MCEGTKGVRVQDRYESTKVKVYKVQDMGMRAQDMGMRAQDMDTRVKGHKAQDMGMRAQRVKWHKSARHGCEGTRQA